MSTLKLPQKMSTAPAAAPAVAPEAPPAAPTVNPDLIQPAPTPQLNPRNQIMKEIAARSNAQADADAKETLPETDEAGNIIEPAAAEAVPATDPQGDRDQTVVPTPGEPADGSGEPAAPAPQAAAEMTPTVAQTPGIDPNADYEITVDGRPMKIKGSQVLARVQKAEAAEYRLELATKILAEAQAKQGALPTGAQPQAVVPAAPAQVSDLELAERVQFGTREQAAEAIAEIRRRAPDAVTTEGLQQFMAAKLPQIVNQQLAYREATQYVEKEYGDLLKDPYLKTLFFVKDDEARKAGDKRSYTELWTAIGDDLRKHFNRPKPGAPAPATTPTTPAAPVTTLAQRQAAKAAAPAAPRLAAARMEGGAEQAKPKTREEVIEGMRRSRGQASLTGR